MTRRDLQFINVGLKTRYDTPPHDRAVLANLRDLALNDKELDFVAALADKFDAEDRAVVEKRKREMQAEQLAEAEAEELAERAIANAMQRGGR